LKKIKKEFIYKKRFYEKRRILFAPIASVAESIVMQHVDTIKVLRQSNQPLPRKIHLYYKRFTVNRFLIKTLIFSLHFDVNLRHCIFS